MDTRFPNEDVYLYERKTQNRAIVEEEKKTIYEYIYVYVKLGKK